MRVKSLFLVLLIASMSINVLFAQKKNRKSKNKFVLIETSEGNIKLKLYDETPIHKENFLKLIQEGFYNDLLFHRVINEFMIQGGDPESKEAKVGAALGNGGPGYTLEAEIIPKYYHKKGALAAARLGDQQNPEKRSSGSQFYLVQGKVFTSEELDNMEAQLNNQLRQQAAKKFFELEENKTYLEEYSELRESGNNEKLTEFAKKLEPIIEAYYVSEGVFKFSDEQRKIYTSIGGTPHLDGGYTVFGEVIEGLDVLEKLSMVETDRSARPKSDLRMKIRLVKK